MKPLSLQFRAVGRGHRDSTAGGLAIAPVGKLSTPSIGRSVTPIQIQVFRQARIASDARAK
jgi:hypothetical protein